MLLFLTVGAALSAPDLEPWTMGWSCDGDQTTWVMVIFNYGTPTTESTWLDLWFDLAAPPAIGTWGQYGCDPRAGVRDLRLPPGRQESA